MACAQVLALALEPETASLPGPNQGAHPAATLAAWLAESPASLAALAAVLHACHARGYRDDGMGAGAWLRRTALAATRCVTHAALAASRHAGVSNPELVRVLQCLVAHGAGGMPLQAAGVLRPHAAACTGPAILA